MSFSLKNQLSFHCQYHYRTLRKSSKIGTFRHVTESKLNFKPIFFPIELPPSSSRTSPPASCSTSTASSSPSTPSVSSSSRPCSASWPTSSGPSGPSPSPPASPTSEETSSTRRSRCSRTTPAITCSWCAGSWSAYRQACCVDPPKWS